MLQVDDQIGPRTIQNYPMQANGAEMLQLACCWTTEAGIRVCMPVHDALLVEAPVDALDETIGRVQQAMASRAVDGAFLVVGSRASGPESAPWVPTDWLPDDVRAYAHWLFDAVTERLPDA
jgi:hypothetical protein